MSRYGDTDHSVNPYTTFNSFCPVAYSRYRLRHGDFLHSVILAFDAALA